MGEIFAHRRIGDIDMDRVPLSDADDASLLQKGDLLFARQSLVLAGAGKCSIFQGAPEPVTFEGHIIRARTNPTLADPWFYFYFFGSPLGRGRIESVVEQVAAAGIRASDLARLHVPHPPLPVQRSIARILGALDDKIELNRTMNETLEQMARAIFKSWFIDFEPFRDQGMVDSPLGKIPKGLKVGTIGEAADVTDCLHTKKPERQDVGSPLLQLWNIRDDGLIDMTDTYFITRDDYCLWVSRIEASPGDCVITNVGRVAAVAQVPAGLKAALGRNMTAIRCKAEFPYPTFLLECLLSASMREEIVQKMDTGTILDALNVKNIPLLRFVMPSIPVLDVFESRCRPLRAKMERALAESRTLAAIRDALLPKLMSGEVRVA